MLAKRLAGKTTVIICFVSKDAVYKDRVEERFFIVMVSFCIFPTYNIFFSFVNFNFQSAATLLWHNIALF